MASRHIRICKNLGMVVKNLFSCRRHFTIQPCHEDEDQKCCKRSSKRKKEYMKFVENEHMPHKSRSVIWSVVQEMRPLFTFKRLKKQYELYPLFLILNLFLASFIAYICFRIFVSVDDARWGKNWKTNAEKVDLLNPRKRRLLVFNQEYPPMEELHSIYQEMEEAEKQLAEEEAAARAAAEEEEAGEDSVTPKELSAEGKISNVDITELENPMSNMIVVESESSKEN